MSQNEIIDCRVLLKYNFFKEPLLYFNIVLVVTSGLLMGNIVAVAILTFILLLMFLAYIQEYSNTLDVDENSVTIKNSVKFWKQFSADKKDIKDFEFNVSVKEKRKYNIRIKLKDESENVFFFQSLTDEDVEKLKRAIE